MAAPAAATLQLEKRSDGLALLWLDAPNRQHNVLNPQALRELDDAFESVATDPGNPAPCHCEPKTVELRRRRGHSRVRQGDRAGRRDGPVRRRPASFR